MTHTRPALSNNFASRLALALLALTGALACATDPAASDATSPLADGAAGRDGAGGGDGATNVGDANGVDGRPLCRVITHLIVQVGVTPAPAYGVELRAAGRVTSSGPGRFVLDRCSLGASCVEAPVSVEVDAQGYEQALPVGALVELRHRAQTYGYAQMGYALSVRNLPEWEGVTNPVASSEFWHLILSEGMGPPEEAPFGVREQKLACAGRPEGFGDEYRLVFGDAEGGATLELGQGESGRASFAGQEWDISVLRSSQSFDADAGPPHAWWALGAPP